MTHPVQHNQADVFILYVKSGAPIDDHLCNTSYHSQTLLQSILGLTMLKSTSSVYKYYVLF